MINNSENSYKHEDIQVFLEQMKEYRIEQNIGSKYSLKELEKKYNLLFQGILSQVNCIPIFFRFDEKEIESIVEGGIKPDLIDDDYVGLNYGFLQGRIKESEIIVLINPLILNNAACFFSGIDINKSKKAQEKKTSGKYVNQYVTSKIIENNESIENALVSGTLGINKDELPKIFIKNSIHNEAILLYFVKSINTYNELVRFGISKKSIILLENNDNPVKIGFDFLEKKYKNGKTGIIERAKFKILDILYG